MLQSQSSSYRNGRIKVAFGHKRKYTSLKSELSADTAFYVIQPTLCGRPADFIKFGKTTDIVRRFAGYARLYEDKFDILHLRIFRRSKLGTAYEEGTGRRVVDFSTPFESAVIAAMKKVATPFRTDSDEIYPASDYVALKQVIARVANDNAPVTVTANRTSKRTVRSDEKKKI